MPASASIAASVGPGPLPKSRPVMPCAQAAQQRNRQPRRGSGDRPGRRHRCVVQVVLRAFGIASEMVRGIGEYQRRPDSEGSAAGSRGRKPCRAGTQGTCDAVSPAICRFIGRLRLHSHSPRLRAADCCRFIRRIRRTAAPRRAAVFVAGCSRCGAQVRQCDKTMCGPPGASELSLPSLRSSSNRSAADALLRVAARLDAAGCGSAASCSTCARAGCACAMSLEELASRRVIPISQELGPGSSSCRLDPAAMAEAAALVGQSIAASPDLFIFNKFGSQELAGAGLRSEMAEVAAAGLPLLTTVRATMSTPGWTSLVAKGCCCRPTRRRFWPGGRPAVRPPAPTSKFIDQPGKDSHGLRSTERLRENPAQRAASSSSTKMPIPSR